MERQTLTWTVFFEVSGRRSVLLRAEADRHWESAEEESALAAEGVRVWVDRDGVPVVVEAVVADAVDEEHPAGVLERLLEPVLGGIQLGSPTLWGRTPGWVWYGVQSTWPVTRAEDDFDAAFQEARDRARRNAARAGLADAEG